MRKSVKAIAAVVAAIAAIVIIAVIRRNAIIPKTDKDERRSDEAQHSNDELVAYVKRLKAGIEASIPAQFSARKGQFGVTDYKAIKTGMTCAQVVNNSGWPKTFAPFARTWRYESENHSGRSSVNLTFDSAGQVSRIEWSEQVHPVMPRIKKQLPSDNRESMERSLPKRLFDFWANYKEDDGVIVDMYRKSLWRNRQQKVLPASYVKKQHFLDELNDDTLAIWSLYYIQATDGWVVRTVLNCELFKLKEVVGGKVKLLNYEIHDLSTVWHDVLRKWRDSETQLMNQNPSGAKPPGDLHKLRILLAYLLSGDIKRLESFTIAHPPALATISNPETMEEALEHYYQQQFGFAKTMCVFK